MKNITHIVLEHIEDFARETNCVFVCVDIFILFADENVFKDNFNEE